MASRQSVQVIIPPELVRSAQTRVLSKSDLEESPMTQRLDYTTIAPAGIKALGSVYGYIVQSGLPRLLVNLVYLRASQINGCAYCIDMPSTESEEHSRRV
jgi:alkylhydroperoxidase family enzyme